MSAILMGWGTFRFDSPARSIERVTERTGGRWERQDLIGRRPGYQFLGADEQSITLEGTIYPYHTGGFSQVQALKAASRTNAISTLASFDGRVFGPFALQRVDDDGDHLAIGGTPKKIGLLLEFLYVADVNGRRLF